MPAPNVTAAATGSAPLALFWNRTILRPNCAARGFWIDCLNGTTVVASTGFRMASAPRLSAGELLAIDSNASRTFRSAVRDVNGRWSEFSALQTASLANFSTSTIEASIASGAISDNDIRAGGMEFPDLSRGSGKQKVFRTLVSSSDNFVDETRVGRWPKGRSAFSIEFDSLDTLQLQLFHRFFRGLSGPQQPFFFEWVPPELGTLTTAPSQRFLVRFRDTKFAGKMSSHNMGSVSFVLIEVIEDPEGGDV